MRFVSALVASALALTASAAAAPKPPTMSCLTPAPNDKQRTVHKQMAAAEAFSAASGSLVSRATTNVDTYVHVVSASKSASDYYLSRDTITKQMSVLNQYYQGTGFQYVLKDIDWTVNYNWSHNGDQIAMKTALRKGDYRTLNLYFITDIGQRNTGYCFYPTDNASPGSYNFINDGCIMSAWTAPGQVAPGGYTTFSTGRITVHEVGHWNYLIHTFDGYSCTGPGDYVDDTPQESQQSSGCPQGRDSCPSQPGLDPINNHMDYSDDTCRTQFTNGQTSRMQSAWDYYRKNA